MKSLHEKHGKDAVKVLQGMMQSQTDCMTLPKGFTTIPMGNHYIVQKGNREMRVPLFSAQEVFKALNMFCS